MTAASSIRSRPSPTSCTRGATVRGPRCSIASSSSAAARTRKRSPGTSYYYADSLRLGHDLAGARKAAGAAKKAAAKIDNDELAERIDLLSFYLARDASACAEARQAIDHFIAQHPQGTLVDLAREEQKRLKSVEGCA